MMDLGLSGRVAMVTGAGSGIGLAATQAFLDEGVAVIAADLNPQALSGLAPPDRLLAVAADLSQADAAAEVVAKGVSAFGRIDILFNNAGIVRPREGFLTVTDDDWGQTLGLNLMGYVRAARAVLPVMLEAGQGVLIHNGSESGRTGSPFAPDYAVSKAAVLMLSSVLSQEFVAKGIRSNVISPAQIRTPILEKPGGMLDVIGARLGVDRDGATKALLRSVGSATGRLGEVEEVIGAVLFLASDQASFISGVELLIDGGTHRYV
jgi:NAD(P)-dependent dehydrogenase (short-subunit alcohol dehydrogenase family)